MAREDAVKLEARIPGGEPVFFAELPEEPRDLVHDWPLLGVFFGYVRGEGMDWRKDRQRRSAYQRATLLLIGMFAARLLVQVPLYFAENVAALGVTFFRLSASKMRVPRPFICS